MKLYIDLPALVLICFITLSSCNRKSDYVTSLGYETITDNGGGTGTTTWTKDKTYLLKGLVFVNDGQILTIEPGTVIRATTGQGENASALIVARGGRIYAEGTSVQPILFTCEGDDLKGSVPLKAKGLWGGVIILGDAPLNNSSNENHIEGIPISEPRGEYGGGNDEDNSGIFRYVSIRHGGTNIGSENEINGLTLGGVGRETTIEYVEVISNVDDGIEFFGGSVNCRYIVSAFNGDDAFDYDLGYRGKGQFLLAIQDVGEGDLLIEGSGGENPETGQPYSLPVFYNSTFIGRGDNISNRAMQLNRNAGGHLGNSIIMNQHSGVYIQYREGYPNCYSQFVNGNIQILNNIFWNVAGNNSEEIFQVYADPGINISNQQAIFRAYFETGANTISDPGIVIQDDSWSLLPTGNISDNLAPEPDPWFLNVDYKGAFLYDNWTHYWTLLHQSGSITD